jgi:antitoxin VapB
MNLQIRDPRAREFAEKIAIARGVSMTEAVIDALKKEAGRVVQRESAIEAGRRIAAELRALGKPGGRDWTREERDDMMGGL